MGSVVMRGARNARRASQACGSGGRTHNVVGFAGPRITLTRRGVTIPSARASRRLQRQYEFGMALRQQALPASVVMLDAATGVETRIAALFMGGGLDDDDGT